MTAGRQRKLDAARAKQRAEAAVLSAAKLWAKEIRGLIREGSWSPSIPDSAEDRLLRAVEALPARGRRVAR